ncbi:MAG: filamentous hemagglutinin N-terminal domain-containing protein, partial [Polaromonas sp.]|nr:filamentous hemagglutinin N-terminal domain-containing protein [Polaromonas sp.]
MNLIHRSLWNDQTGTFVAVSENTRSAGKRASSCTTAAGGHANFGLKLLAVSLMMACGAGAVAQPAGGVVSAGSASIGGTAGNMTITQTTPNVAINWQSFGIKAGESVQFVQPGSSSVALNRVTGSDPSSILGSLSSNGKVFLVNPNGILFGQGASVNVGGLLASTLAITDASFMANNYAFSGAGTGSVVNQGTINAASGGYVALLGANVSNQGVIAAQLGTVALAAGSAVTLDMAGDKLLNVTVNQGAVNALVENGGMVRADGGQVLMTTQAAGSLLANAVNNTGVVQAQTLQNINGTIKLLGSMENGTMNVGGTLDASAPGGGAGGFIETSAAHVKIANDLKVTTAAPTGLTGTWLIDPQDFVVGSGATDNIAGATLSALLVTNSVVISTATGSRAMVAGTPPVTSIFTATPGNGDINVNEAITWTASSSPTTLTLNAVRDVNVNKAITVTNGSFEACCGRDVNINAAITTVNGSVLLSAGGNVNLKAALSTTDGNITMCAANDVNISAPITLIRGANMPAQSLGLPLGLVLSAGYGGTGPGVDGGTVTFAPGTPRAVVTGPNAPVTIHYNPVSYTAPADYLPNFTLSNGASLTQYMRVFAAGGNKTFDGTTAATLLALKGNPAGVTLVKGPGSTANFDSASVGQGKTIRYTGYSLGGTQAGKYALASSCCGPVVARTTANITAPVIVRPPIVVVPPSVDVDVPDETTPIETTPVETTQGIVLPETP